MSRSLAYLRASQNADGGWGYKANGMSFVEPTAAVICALSPDASSQPQVQRARGFLRGLQRADGGWGIAALDDESGWMTAWGVWALAGGDAADTAAAQKGVEWLLKEAGLRVTDKKQIEDVEKVLHIDATITGWAWQPGDAAWIFPSALALVALDAMGVKEHARVKEGLQYLLDRAIATGGWNIGNPFMVSGSMPPTVENTALALIALDAFGVENEATAKAAEWLGHEGFTNTAFEWAWRALYARRTLRLRSGQAPDPSAALRAGSGRWRDGLVALQREDGSWDGNPFTSALAVMAFEGEG